MYYLYIGIFVAAVASAIFASCLRQLFFKKCFALSNPAAEVRAACYYWAITQLVVVDTLLVTSIAGIAGVCHPPKKADLFDWSTDHLLQNCHLIVSIILVMDSAFGVSLWFMSCLSGEDGNCSDNSSGTELATIPLRQKTAALQHLVQKPKTVEKREVNSWSWIVCRSNDADRDDADQETPPPLKSKILPDIHVQTNQRMLECSLNITQSVGAVLTYVEASSLVETVIPAFAVQVALKLKYILTAANTHLKPMSDATSETRDTSCSRLAMRLNVSWHILSIVFIVIDCILAMEAGPHARKPEWFSSYPRLIITRVIIAVLLVESTFFVVHAAVFGDVAKQLRERYPDLRGLRRAFMSWVGEYLFATHGGYAKYVSDLMTVAISICNEIGLSVPIDVLRLTRPIVDKTQETISWAATKLAPEDMDALLDVLLDPSDVLEPLADDFLLRGHDIVGKLAATGVLPNNVVYSKKIA